MHSLPTRLCAFLRREAVLSIALLCAALSMLAVPPDAGYAGYIDLRVLCLLFCLMAVVAGLQQCGLFQVLSQRLLMRPSTSTVNGTKVSSATSLVISMEQKNGSSVSTR